MSERTHWNIELHKREDDNLLFDLQKITYPDHNIYKHENLAAQYLQWRYYSNTSIHSRIYIVKSKDGSKIIGMRPISIIPIKIMGEIKKSVFFSAVITHPDYRNRGIFSSLVKYSVNASKELGADFAFTFPNEISYPLYKRNKNWSVVSINPIYFKIVNFKNLFFQKLIHRNYLAKDTKGNKTGISTKSRMSIKKMNFFSEEYDRLSMDESESERVIIPRTSEYLRWRYLDNPIYRYDIYELRGENDNLHGYIITSTQQREGFYIGIIVDYFVKNVNGNDFHHLLNTAISELKGNNIDILITLIPSTFMYKNYFIRKGFMPMPRIFKSKRINIVASIFNPIIRDHILNFRSWYITWGDTDNV